MSFGNRLWSGVVAVWIGITLGGCLPPGQNQSDEEKEPHYVLGLSRVNAMDYQGAIQAFEESLETNPHSAAAHFQLAMLYENKEPDPAAAIYHYQQYLKFDPGAGNAEIIKQHIASCKQELAADVMPLPSTPVAQKQINQLIEQNQQLQDEVNKWRAYYTSQLAAKNQAAPIPDPEVAQAPANPVSPQPAQNVATPVGPSGGDRSTRSTATKATTRTHMVAAGETAVRIARRYGVSLDALLAANPGLEPRRMRVGQVLSIPPP